MIGIEIRHLDRTCLQYDAFYSMLKKYTKGLKNNILIVFDKRLTSMGTHRYNYFQKIHVIRVSPERAQYTGSSKDKVRLDSNSEKFNIIGTILHEIKHAKQFEEMGSRYNRHSFTNVKEISNPEYSEWYSQCEIEARIYETKNLRTAVDYYNSYISQ